MASKLRQVKMFIRADDMLTIASCRKSLALRICGEIMCSEQQQQDKTFTGGG